MKVLLLTPSPQDVFRGSDATVRRYRAGLQRRGHLCEVFGGTQDGGLKQSLEGVIGRFRPDIVHAHHASRTAIGLLGLQTPWVVSVAGEDLHRDMVDDDGGALVCEVFRRAHRVLVPLPDSARLLEERVPETIGKLDLVPRSAEALPTDGTDLRRSLGISRSRFLILLPGGIRAIKGQHRAISLVTALRQSGIDAEMIIIGPAQDADYAADLERLVAEEPGVRLLPSLSRERMGAAYADADVVLSTSLGEAMSPCLLEAGALGRPVVASACAGNAELIRHKDTGLLFDDEEQMTKQVLALARNRSAAGALGLRLREDLRQRFSAEHELDCLLSAYAAA